MNILNQLLHNVHSLINSKPQNLWSNGQHQPVNDAPGVQVVDGGDELSHEGPRGRLAQATVRLALEVGEQLTARGVLRDQTVQRRGLRAATIDWCIARRGLRAIIIDWCIASCGLRASILDWAITRVVACGPR